MKGRFEVAVVGAGPAGAATALALRRLGVEGVALLAADGADGADGADRPRIGESIPPDTRLLLTDLGLWESFVAEGHDPCHGSCSSWGADDLGYNDFLFSPYGHGYHLDRRRFDGWLARAAEAAGARLGAGARIDSVDPIAGGGFRLRGAGPGGDASGTDIEARFVVDATGRAARVARKLGARRLVHDRLTFVYGFFPEGSARRAHGLTTLEAARDGWWYAARLPGGRLVAAFACDPAASGEDTGGPGDDRQALPLSRDRGTSLWLRRFRATRHVRGLLEADAPPDSLVACEALSACLDRAAGAGWLAVGDAASSFDPLSAQGIHKALEDGLRAARAIDAHRRGELPDLGSYSGWIRNRFAAYLANRSHFYALERRWWDAPFWAGRRAR